MANALWRKYHLHKDFDTLTKKFSKLSNVEIILNNSLPSGFLQILLYISQSL